MAAGCVETVIVGAVRSQDAPYGALAILFSSDDPRRAGSIGGMMPQAGEPQSDDIPANGGEIGVHEHLGRAFGDGLRSEEDVGQAFEPVGGDVGENRGMEALGEIRGVR